VLGFQHARIAIRGAEQQHGVVARFQLRRAGLPPHVARYLLPAKEWEQVTSEVFRRRGSPRTEAQRLVVAVLDSGPGAALSHLPAARWWGLTGCSARPAHVVRTSASRRRSELAVLHRVSALPTEWLTRLDDVPICRPELVAMQLFAVCSVERAARLTDSLWSMRLLSGPSIERFLDHYGARGRNGIAGLREYLAERGPGYVPPASGLEGRAMRLFDDAGIAMRRQVDSGGDARWTGRVDFRHVELPVIVEIQSERYHAALCDRVADAARLEALRRAGYEVVELTDVDVWSRPRECVERVRAAMRRAQLRVP